MTTEHVFPQALQAGDLAQATGGMTLRAAFAMAAMQARLNAAWTEPGPSKNAYQEFCAKTPPDTPNTSFHEWIALSAVQQADALIAALQADAEN